MDVYGISTPDYFRIDDLLDFSNEDLFSPSTSTSSSVATDHHHPLSLPQNPSLHPSDDPFTSALSTDFTDHLSVPSDDMAELEWLSQFVDDSFTDFPANSNSGVINVGSETSFCAKARSKRSRGTVPIATSWTSSSPETPSPSTVKLKPKKEFNRASSPTADGGVRRCTHCASEKTPQWRTGPLGPKTLCNACGVRYKSGRLVPEYRPAASPTFVLTQHSNSHRKVLELRRQKEMLRQQQQQQQEEQRIYHPHHPHHIQPKQDFKVC